MQKYPKLPEMAHARLRGIPSLCIIEADFSRLIPLLAKNGLQLHVEESQASHGKYVKCKYC